MLRSNRYHPPLRDNLSPSMSMYQYRINVFWRFATAVLAEKVNQAW